MKTIVTAQQYHFLLPQENGLFFLMTFLDLANKILLPVIPSITVGDSNMIFLAALVSVFYYRDFSQCSNRKF